MKSRFINVKLIGDCGTYTLEYTPNTKGGKPQSVRLDAENEDDAKFEAANILECKEEEVPEIEWC